MSISSDVLFELAALQLAPDQMAGVLKIIARMAQENEARRASQRERTARHRAKRHDSNSYGNEAVTLQPCYTPPHPLKNNSSSYEEEDKQINAPTRESAREPRARRLPDDWMPSEADTAAAAQLGFSPADIDGEVARMRDWSRSAKDGARKDWSAFFRNWMRRRLETTGPPARSAQVTSLFPGDRNDRAGNPYQRSRDGARSPTGHGAYAALLDPRPADDPGIRG